MCHWITRATYYKLDLDNDKLLSYVGWSETSKEHWLELVRWVKSGNVMELKLSIMKQGGHSFYKEMTLKYFVMHGRLPKSMVVILLSF